MESSNQTDKQGLPPAYSNFHVVESYHIKNSVKTSGLSRKLWLIILTILTVITLVIVTVTLVIVLQGNILKEKNVYFMCMSFIF